MSDEIELCKDYIIQELEEDPQVLHEQWSIESLEEEKELDELYELALDPDSWVLYDEKENVVGHSENEGERTYSFSLEPSEERFFAHVTLDSDHSEVIDCVIATE